MTTVRLRLLGGACNGQVLWVAQDCQSVNVNVAGGGGVPKTLQYRREGTIAVFVPEAAAAAP
jgi:hypothetical protein